MTKRKFAANDQRSNAKVENGRRNLFFHFIKLISYLTVSDYQLHKNAQTSRH